MEKLQNIILVIVAIFLFLESYFCDDVSLTRGNENLLNRIPSQSLDDVIRQEQQSQRSKGNPGLFKATHYMYKLRQVRHKRDTVRDSNRLWKHGQVVYKMAKSISPAAKSALQKAFEHIEKRTCVRFLQKKPSDKDYIMFLSEPGCWSDFVGRNGGRQDLSLGYGCTTMGAAIHEIMHALGFWHEQTRTDRDKYVKIHLENVSKWYRNDFKKLNDTVSTSRGFPYDYGSIMHYEDLDFSRNGEPSLEVIGIGKKLTVTLGQRKGLSTIDMAQIRDMYNCNQKAAKAVAGKCVKSNFGDGRDYRGDVDYTRRYVTCQKWSEDYPHNHTLVEMSKAGAQQPTGEDSNGLGDHNKCRNPTAMRRERPWCYTSKVKPEWDYCDITICKKFIRSLIPRVASN